MAMALQASASQVRKTRFVAMERNARRWSCPYDAIGDLQRVSRLNVDFPSWVVQGLDRKAQRLGVMRQGPIKPLIAARLG